MWLKVIKWVLGIIAVAIVLYITFSGVLLWHILTNTKHTTYFGTIDTDTAQIGMYSHHGDMPCYLVHTTTFDSVKEETGERKYIHDTVRYYYCRENYIFYYKDYKDSLGNRVIKEFDPDIGYESDSNLISFFKEWQLDLALRKKLNIDR